VRPTDRQVRILTGLIAAVVLFATAVIGIEYSGGHFDNTYRLIGSFDTAGQGLIQKSDVKIRGFTVGEVAGVHLRNGRAEISMRIHGGEKIPRTASATIRPKTLFGEKFIDIDVGNEQGPFLSDGDHLRHTVGGFELERVLTDAVPLLDALDPADVATVLGTLADAQQGEGERLGHELAAQARVAEVFARHADDTRKFLDDFDTLSAGLERGAPDLTAAATNLNRALPTLNAQASKLDPFLTGVADLARTLAGVLETNQSTLVELATDGGKTLQVLDDKRARIEPLLNGLREFLQVLTELGRYGSTEPFTAADGTHLAAIKFVAGGGPLVAPSLGPAQTSATGTTRATRILQRGAGAITAALVRSLTGATP